MSTTLQRNLRAITLLGAISLLNLSARSQALFSDDFQTDTSASWSIFAISGNGASNDYTAQFAFDYSNQAYRYNGVTNHVPPAPNSGGTTKGLKLTVNKNGSASIAAVSLYPVGQNFSNNYSLKFDLWTDYSGDIPFGDGGSTEFTSFGINHFGTNVNWPATTQNGDGHWFSVSADGGSGTDFRAFVGDSTPGPNLELLGTDGGFPDRDNDGTPEQNTPDTGFSPFQLLFPAPPGQTSGAIGKQWVQVEVRQQSGTVSWLMNGYLMAQHANDFGAPHAFTSGNIMLGHQDPYFAELPDEPYENYAIFDNVRVVDLGTNEPLPILDVSATDPNASEPGADTGIFTITRTGSATNDLTVHLRIAGTASNGVDYVTIPSTITLKAGDSSTNITVTPINDSIGEPVETVILMLVGNTTNYDVRNNYAIVNISDDNDVPTARIEASRPSTYENQRAGLFNIIISNPNASDTTVNFTTSGTAVNGVAYSSIPTSAVIPAGQTNASISINPINNSNRDGVRTITLRLGTGSGYTLGSITNATEILYDDDVVQGPPFFADDFETNSASLWIINRSQSDGVALFGYDYSADGIPSAPHSGSTTRGLKLAANDTNAVASGISVSPLGGNFTGDYRLRYDLWINYNGPLFDGGSGSTEFVNGGIGTKGIAPQWSGGGSGDDSIWFACDGDGGNGLDYRAYKGSTHLTAASNPTVYPAGGQAVTSPYYASFGGDPAPLAQQNGPFGGNQTGTTGVGNPGFAWHDVMITKQSNTITWVMDGIKIAGVDATGFALSTNVFVGFYDPTSGVSPIPDLSFAIIDNLRVATMQPPAITSIQVVGSNVRLDFTASTIDTPASFTLQSASTVNGTYSDVSSTITPMGAGTFRAILPLNGVAQYYRVRR
jgi:hypothetical protein